MGTGWLRPGVGTGLGEAWCKDCAGGREEEGQKNIDFSREVLKFIKKIVIIDGRCWNSFKKVVIIDGRC